MRIAFYAPLKAPTHPVPSGDRRVARAFLQALRLAGHEVVLASRFRSWEGAGSQERQSTLEGRGRAIAARLIAQYRSDAGARPDLWFTYHLYHKAPDWLGPPVAAALGLPYVVAEASAAAKQSRGPWARGYEAACAAMARADALIQLNGDDAEGVARVVPDAKRIARLPPFLDTAPYRRATPARSSIAAAHGLDAEMPWLLTVAMMRSGAKLASYRVLAAAMAPLLAQPWQLVLVGDGPARREVKMLFAGFPEDRTRFLGVLPGTMLPALYASSDLYLWPAIHEAFGMSFLEAQAAGLPVVAGRERGVPELVRDGETGILVPPGDSRAFAAGVARLLAEGERRRAMGRRGRALIGAAHDIAPAAERLGSILAGAVERRRAA